MTGFNRGKTGSLSRRRFLARASASVTAGAVFAGFGCTSCMQYRILSRTGIKASIINSEERNRGGVAVSDILRYSMYRALYGVKEEVRAYYALLPRSSHIDAVTDLTCYEQACPYGLPVVEMLIEEHALLS